MKRLEDIKGKMVAIPVKAKRYIPVFFYNGNWESHNLLYTTPEEAAGQIQRFNKAVYGDKIEYYTVIEVELPMPI